MLKTLKDHSVSTAMRNPAFYTEYLHEVPSDEEENDEGIREEISTDEDIVDTFTDDSSDDNSSNNGSSDDDSSNNGSSDEDYVP